jgi:hypothetical protein
MKIFHRKVRKMKGGKISFAFPVEIPVCLNLIVIILSFTAQSNFWLIMPQKTVEPSGRRDS